MFHYLEGKIIKTKEPKISAFDLGFLRGYGIFDYIRTYGPLPFLLKEHLSSFLKRAKLSELKIPLSLSKIKKIIFELSKKNYQGKDLGFRIILTAGPDALYSQKKGNSFLILTNNIQEYPLSFYQKGIKIISSPKERSIASLKSLSSYFVSFKEYLRAQKKNFNDVLFLDKDKKILECFTSNFFAVKNKELITPKINEKIFAGTTRNLVLKIAKENNLKVKERNIFFNEIKNFSEAFLTSTSKEIMPVSQIDRFKLKAPGPLTLFLMKLFRNYVEKFKISASPR